MMVRQAHIPKGWEVKTLQDIGSVFSGNSINAKIKQERYLDLLNGMSYVATKDVSYESEINYDNGIKIPFNEVESFRVARKNSVLICAEGGSAGRKIGITNQDICFVNKLFAITPENEITSRYLFYWYHSESFKTEFKSRLTGLIGGVSKKKFVTIPIPIPPLDEQKRIVAKLDELFALIENGKLKVENLLADAKELFQSQLNEIFDELDSNWESNPLNSLIEKNRIITYGVIKLGEETPDGVPCLRTSNVRWLNIDANTVKKISHKISNNYSRTILCGGEVLVNVRGSLGGVAVATEQYKGWNVSREVSVVPIDQEKINSQYLSYYIGADFSQKWLGKVKKGAAYVGINIKDLRKLQVKAPNIIEQKQIVHQLDELKSHTQALETKYQQELDALDELKKSILQKGFNGEL